jgi:hypothetical protein
MRAWGRQNEWPGKLDRKALGRLRKLLPNGKSQAECAAILGVSLQTVGRVVARMRKGYPSGGPRRQMTSAEGAAPRTSSA